MIDCLFVGMSETQHWILHVNIVKSHYNLNRWKTWKRVWGWPILKNLGLNGKAYFDCESVRNHRIKLRYAHLKHWFAVQNLSANQNTQSEYNIK